ncbi:hypothetical protein [Massilia putida]|uniref:hypothetical protein n=1 Tax=Massilia putida TaxID=1141883 RepID=UPI000951B302|nr:hypothetical protein [Massilia putida]
MTRRPLIAVLLALCAAGAAAEQTITASDIHVARMGRTVAAADGTVRFGYPGVTLLLAVDGTRLAVDTAGGTRSLVDVIVDGKPAGTLRLAPQMNRYDILKGDAYTAVLRDHPHTQVALTEGVLLDGDKKAALIGYLEEAMARVGDRRVHLLAPAAHRPGDAVNGHPTTDQHAAMAAELLPQLRRPAGW